MRRNRCSCLMHGFCPRDALNNKGLKKMSTNQKGLMGSFIATNKALVDLVD